MDDAAGTVLGVVALGRSPPHPSKTERANRQSKQEKLKKTSNWCT